MKISRQITDQITHLLFVALLFCGSGLLSAAQETPSNDPDQGWQSSLQYNPNTGFIYSLGSMRDGRTIPVFLGVKSTNRKVIVNHKTYKIATPGLQKKEKQPQTYTYQFRDIYTGSTTLTQTNTWQFTVKRTITALKDMKLQWWDNYLNSYLIAGKIFHDPRNGKTITIHQQPLPTSKMFTVLGKGQLYKEMRFDSAIGVIDLKFSVKMNLVDHRKATWRGQDNAYLIYRSFNLKKGQSLQLDVQVKITPDFDQLKTYQPAAAEKDIYTSQSPVPSRHIVMPDPKEITWGQGSFHLGTKARIFHHPADNKIVKRAQSFFLEMFQIDLQEQSLSKQWKNTLVLSNGNLPENIDLKLRQLHKKVTTLKPAGSYVLQVTNNAILIVGKSSKGICNALGTLFQLSRHQTAVNGIDYDQVNIADYPDFDQRGIYVRIQSDLDLAWSRQFVAAMSELKYNIAYLHFARGIGVRFDAQPPCYDQSQPSISIEKFTEFVRYIQSLNMQIIPIWSTGKTMLPPKHFQKFPELDAMTINQNKHWDISLDQTFNYHKSILDQIIQITGTKTIHLGLDEIYHFALACRKNTGRGDLILANYINKFTDYYAPRGIRTIVYHDMLLNRKDVPGNENGYFPANAHEGSEKALGLLKNKNMLTIEDWTYSENKVYPDFDYFFSKGFDVYSSPWYRYENIMGLSAYVQGRTDTFVCTYWALPRNVRSRGWDPRGNRQLNGRFKTYKFLPAMGLGAEAAWNAGKRDLSYNFLEETLLLFNQRKGQAPDKTSCIPVDLSNFANMDLAGKRSGNIANSINPQQTLSSFPTGKQTLSGIPFFITKNSKNQATAVSIKGTYSPNLPEKVRIPLKKERYTNLIFLHTCQFDFDEKDMHKDLKARYIITYEDGTTQQIKLVNDENIMAWAPALTRFDPDNDSLWLAWTGMTKENLPTSVYGYSWKNPQPQKIIQSVQLQAEKKSSTLIYLIALTGIK